MSAEWGMLPLGIEESDLVMLLFALFILALLVIAMFIVFPWYFAIIGTLIIALGIVYGVRELKQKEDLNDN